MRLRIRTSSFKKEKTNRIQDRSARQKKVLHKHTQLNNQTVHVINTLYLFNEINNDYRKDVVDENCVNGRETNT